MTELAWTPSATGWRAPAPQQLRAPLEQSELLRTLVKRNPLELPSGINNFSVVKDDHIAVLVFNESPRLDQLVRDFVLAGVENPVEDEHLTLELTEGQDIAGVRSSLEESLGDDLPPEVDVVGWERNSGDYEPSHFTREGMYRAIDNEAIRLSNVPRAAVLRVASEDCSKFMAWLDNPADYLAYEYELRNDLSQRLHGRPFLQLCTFRAETFRSIATQHPSFDYATAMLDVVASHNRLVVVDDDDVLTGAPAIRKVVMSVGKPKVLRGWRNLLSFAIRAFVTRKGRGTP
jgi:hypothetical protein